MSSASQAVQAAIHVRGIRLTNVGMEDALNAIDAALASGNPARIAFVNADCVNLAARDEGYRDSLEAMDWIFVDGIGMRLAGWILEQNIRDNVNGTDLFPKLCAELAMRGRSLFLLGAKPGVAAAAADWARAHYPGLRIAGAEDGYFPESASPEVARRIRQARPDVLLVAMGAPRQEHWIARHAAAAGATVTLGVGGLFDYYSGNIPRAPGWMRRAGLEWVFRLIQEPGRLWKRYLVGNFSFLLRIAGDRVRLFCGRKP